MRRLVPFSGRFPKSPVLEYHWLIAVCWYGEPWCFRKRSPLSVIASSKRAKVWSFLPMCDTRVTMSGSCLSTEDFEEGIS